MTPEERQKWRDLVQHAPIMPLTPMIRPLRSGPGRTVLTNARAVATN
jgi:hypothetical protein